jgi:hypothetical protein
MLSQEAFRHPAEIVCLFYRKFKFGFRIQVYIQNAGSGSDSQGHIRKRERPQQSYSFHSQTRTSTLMSIYLCPPSALRQAAVDYDLRASDIAGLFASEEECCICDVPGGTHFPGWALRVSHFTVAFVVAVGVLIR